MAKFTGQTADLVEKEVAKAKNGVLFIDEIGGIVCSVRCCPVALSRHCEQGREDEKGSFQDQAVVSLLAALDPPTCVIILAGYKPDMDKMFDMNAGLRSRMTGTLDLLRCAHKMCSL